MKRAMPTIFTTAFVLAPTISLAHTGHGDTNGLAHGLIHPITGIDHVLAMVAVGVLSAQLGGRALLLVPLSFVGVMAVAGALGAAGIQLPFAEVGIALSVIVLGLAVGFRLKLPVLAAMALVSFFAVFHGYVHGAEMPAATSGLPYAAGFIGATALLLGVGEGLGLVICLKARELGRRAVQAVGAVMALSSIAFITNLL
jgi:urease accessory protein